MIKERYVVGFVCNGELGEVDAVNFIERYFNSRQTALRHFERQKRKLCFTTYRAPYLMDACFGELQLIKYKIDTLSADYIDSLQCHHCDESFEVLKRVKNCCLETSVAGNPDGTSLVLHISHKYFESL
jgi:hypothetical protein